MSSKTVLSPTLYFSYGQFAVYDLDSNLPGLDWEDGHFAQGFARQESIANFRTILNYGWADVSTGVGNYEAQAWYERVIAIPFCLRSGQVRIVGPDEFDVIRTITIPVGHYRLVVAQYVIDDNEGEEKQGIDIFFQPLEVALTQSEILVADDELKPIYPLLETAGIAGED